MGRGLGRRQHHHYVSVGGRESSYSDHRVLRGHRLRDTGNRGPKSVGWRHADGFVFDRRSVHLTGIEEDAYLLRGFYQKPVRWRYATHHIRSSRAEGAGPAHGLAAWREGHGPGCGQPPERPVLFSVAGP